ncbi:hypothetical protein AMAG_19137 [Allomyces macrogynus ATCC 38327]|uniref:Uncharacterized protein n=1 Tax=Allomyces macrogynus (strain ATCC 38327) TaxID=578462 RepID=A0A0L0SP17_ALLM3|nr:hypothetical protein AMAG_19137 [Allomyces macrogynus ATCC 38327]|eukprot:KNE64237.1 hypothetical protein AMAG_19137 [Allomyces macrogynus ATCC 38327]
MSYSHTPHAPDARFPPVSATAGANDDDGATLVDQAVPGTTNDDSVGLALFSPAAIDMWWWTGTMPDDAFPAPAPDWIPSTVQQPAFFPPTHALHGTGGAHAAHAAVEPTLSAGHSPPWLAASSSSSTMSVVPGGPLALAAAAPTVVNVFRSAGGGDAPTLCLLADMRRW